MTYNKLHNKCYGGKRLNRSKSVWSRAKAQYSGKWCLLALYSVHSGSIPGTPHGPQVPIRSDPLNTETGVITARCGYENKQTNKYVEQEIQIYNS